MYINFFYNFLHNHFPYKNLRILLPAFHYFTILSDDDDDDYIPYCSVGLGWDWMDNLFQLGICFLRNFGT